MTTSKRCNNLNRKASHDNTQNILAKQGLDGLTFLRESKSIKLHEEPGDEIVLNLTAGYQPPTKYPTKGRNQK
jgi:hypothetical protein